MQALEKIKQITGGDPVSIDRKMVSELPAVYLKCRFTIACNTLPELPDHAQAMRPRLLLLSFDNSYAGREDTGLKKRLCEEAPGVLMWALEGLKRLKRNGKFTMPAASEHAINEFTRLSSPVGEFLAECCVVEVGLSIDRDRLYDCWSSWCNATGSRAGSLAQMSAKMLSVDPQIELINQNRDKVFINIALNQRAKIRYLGKPN